MTSRSQHTLITIGIFFVIIGLWRQFFPDRDSSLLLANGVKVMAVIVDKGNRKGNAYYKYAFLVKGKYYDNWWIPGIKYEKGDSVEIIYLPGDPDVSLPAEYFVVNKPMRKPNPAGNIYFFVDKTIIDLSKHELNVFLDVSGELIPFNYEKQIIFPRNIRYELIDGFVFVFESDTIKFYNQNKKLKDVNLPSKIPNLTPDYEKEFAEQTNIFLTIDNFPYESTSRMEIAKRNAGEDKDLREIVVAELEYGSITSTQTISNKQ